MGSYTKNVKQISITIFLQALQQFENPRTMCTVYKKTKLICFSSSQPATGTREHSANFHEA